MKFNTQTVFAIAMFFSILLFAAGFKHGKVEGKAEAENKPFIELVDMIKNNRSVFVVNKTDVTYLMKDSK